MKDSTKTNISSQHNLTKKKKYSGDPLFFLNHQSYGTYNRKLACHIGLAAAVLLAELIEKRNYHLHELISDQRHGDGWFYHTIESVEERTGLSKNEQPTALKKLQEAGFVEIKSFGLPCKRHFRLHEEAILAFFGFTKGTEDPEAKKPVSEFQETGRLESRNYPPVNQETAPIIYNTKEDTKEETTPPTPLKGEAANAAKVGVSQDISSDQKTSFGTYGHVQLTERENAMLLKHMDEKERAYWIETVDNEIGKQSPKKFNKKYASHYHTILSWKRLREEKNGEFNQAKIAKHRQGSKLLTKGDYDEDNFRRQRL